MSGTQISVSTTHLQDEADQEFVRALGGPILGSHLFTACGRMVPVRSVRKLVERVTCGTCLRTNQAKESR